MRAGLIADQEVAEEPALSKEELIDPIKAAVIPWEINRGDNLTTFKLKKTNSIPHQTTTWGPPSTKWIFLWIRVEGSKLVS